MADTRSLLRPLRPGGACSLTLTLTRTLTRTLTLTLALALTRTRTRTLTLTLALALTLTLTLTRWRVLSVHGADDAVVLAPPLTSLIRILTHLTVLHPYQVPISP